jgi:hypothetical protein
MLDTKYTGSSPQCSKQLFHVTGNTSAALLAQTHLYNSAVVRFVEECHRQPPAVARPGWRWVSHSVQRGFPEAVCPTRHETAKVQQQGTCSRCNHRHLQRSTDSAALNSTTSTAAAAGRPEAMQPHIHTNDVYTCSNVRHTAQQGCLWPDPHVSAALVCYCAMSDALCQ